MAETNIKGDIAELAVAKRYLELGCWVSIPFGDDATYDLIVDYDGKLKKIQVKHLKPLQDTLRFKLQSNTSKNYKGVIDLIVGYNPETGKIYQIKPDDFNSNTAVSLKLNKPKNNQSKGIHFAEDYIL